MPGFCYGAARRELGDKIKQDINLGFVTGGLKGSWRINKARLNENSRGLYLISCYQWVFFTFYN